VLCRTQSVHSNLCIRNVIIGRTITNVYNPLCCLHLFWTPLTTAGKYGNPHESTTWYERLDLAYYTTNHYSSSKLHGQWHPRDSNCNGRPWQLGNALKQPSCGGTPGAAQADWLHTCGQHQMAL
jgi:hypothetical protein